MGQQPHKYHISDDGKVYRINEDGSFTSVGNIQDIENFIIKHINNNLPPGSQTGENAIKYKKVNWWKRNYNWLWVITLVVFIGWFIYFLSLSLIVNPFVEDEYLINNTLDKCSGILFCYGLSWFLSKKNKTILQLAQILMVGLAIWFTFLIYWFLDGYYFHSLCYLASIPLTMWIITLCLSIFRRR